MKKTLLFATAMMFLAASSFAEGGKGKKKACAKGKTCCSKSGKSCSKEKEAKEAKEVKM